MNDRIGNPDTAGARVVRAALLALALSLGGSVLAPAFAGPQDDEERLTAEDLELIDVDRRRGDVRQVLDDLDEIVDELPGDFLARAFRALARFDDCDYSGAIEDAKAAFDAAARGEGVPAADLARCARTYASILIALGRTPRALEVIESAGAALRPDEDARDAWVVGSVLLEAGRRGEAFATFRLGSEARAKAWDELLDQARCQRALGRIRAAARTLTLADEVARDGNGVEPDVLVELADAYFEAYGEVDNAVAKSHSSAQLYREALAIHPEHEGARLGQFALHRLNWRRTSLSRGEILDKILEARPRSVPGLLLRVSAALDDGDLRTARGGLDKLERIAPNLRAVRTERAGLLWIEHARDDARAILDELVAVDGGDARPEREVGRHLLELYRFAEALPFVAKAVERNPLDWTAWTLLGRAQANTGDEDAARESLERATEVAEGRHDAWRDNMALVLRRMDETMIEHAEEELTFLWRPDAAPVLERYLVPFYEGAREELAARYGFTPDPVRIEVFRNWGDFSVRSTGFEGFPALGVCFGPVVTAVSPLARELRGSFSWARTSYHEFTHVIHLGLSHNRCPRWVTEGLATWEEGTKRGAWWRNLRREMLDARANDQIFPVRRLNGAFRGSSVIFAYYQSGLLCKMLIDEHGFAPIVRLLEAFDRGLDLDGALDEVYGTTPEELDARFGSFVDAELASLVIEPRWSPASTLLRRFSLDRSPPDGEEERAAWQEEWCRVAWGSYWSRELVDANEALRIAGTGGELPARGLFLMGELSIANGDREAARRAFERGFDRGGEDYRARMALGALCMQAGETSEAEAHFLVAEQVFPGYEDPRFSAELRLADLYVAQGRDDEASAARQRWLAWNADDYDVHLQVAEWLAEQGRLEEAVDLFESANHVDPFRRHLHLVWGRALYALGRFDEALREFEVGLLVDELLDADVALAKEIESKHAGDDGGDQLIDLSMLGGGPGGADIAALLERWTKEEPLLLGYRALALIALERADEARPFVEAALALDEACAPALEARDALK